MSLITKPPLIKFSEWVPWHDRDRLRRKDRRWLGVYLWAHFKQAPQSATCPYPDLPEEMIYVGETKDLDFRPLSGRQHHRLTHYVDTFPRDREFKFLYVSVFRVCCFQPGDKEEYFRLRGFTRYVEVRIYWEYTQRFGRRAALDYKKGGFKD